MTIGIVVVTYMTYITYYVTPITLVITIFSVAYGIQKPNFVRPRSGRNKIEISWIKLKYDLMLSFAKLLYWYRKYGGTERTKYKNNNM